MATKKGRGKAKALPKEPEIFTIHGDIVQETEDAILVDCGADKPVWFPKSQIEYEGQRDDVDVEIRIPDWLAEQEGLHDGQGNQIVKASEEYAEVSAAISRVFYSDHDDALKFLADEIADAEIMRQQLCLIFPNLHDYLEEAYRIKLGNIARRTKFQGQLDL